MCLGLYDPSILVSAFGLHYIARIISHLWLSFCAFLVKKGFYFSSAFEILIPQAFQEGSNSTGFLLTQQ